MSAEDHANTYARRFGYASASLLVRAEECETRAARSPSPTARDELRRMARLLREDAERAEVA